MAFFTSRSESNKSYRLIVPTFLIAMVFTILPLPNAITWYRPLWVLMVLICWLITSPHRVGVVTAWFIGLLLDFLSADPFGLHALTFALIAYLMIKLHSRICGLPFWQQIILVFVIVIVYMAFVYWLLALRGFDAISWHFWIPVLTTTLLWPWVFLLHKDLQLRFEIR